MKKILFIGIGKEENQKQRMLKALVKAGVGCVYVKWSELAFLGNKLYAQSKEIDLKQFGAVFFDTPRFTVKSVKSNKKIAFNLGNELQLLLTSLKENNVYTLNQDFFLKYPYYNKFSQAYIFASNEIPSIPTLHLADNKVSKISEILIEKNFNFPIIVKEGYGEGGEGVWKLDNQLELNSFIAKRRSENLIFQPFIKNDGDYRVIVANGKCLGIMKRSAQGGEWKNNFSLGGEVARHEDEEMKKFAVKACQKMKLDMAGLDIFSTPTGFLVIEANLFFGLDGFESVFEELDVSAEIVKMLVAKLEEDNGQESF